MWVWEVVEVNYYPDSDIDPQETLIKRYISQADAYAEAMAECTSRFENDDGFKSVVLELNDEDDGIIVRPQYEEDSYTDDHYKCTYIQIEVW